MPNSGDYYISRKRRFLKEFDLYLKFSHQVLVENFGKEHIQDLATEARQEFENLIPLLPYIGGKQPFTRFIVFTAMLLALYRVNKAHGSSLEQTGGLIYEIGRSIIGATPVFLLRPFTPNSFSSRAQIRLRKRAIQSHQRKYPGDYVYNYVPGDGKTFDYGVDYLECASCKFLAQQGAAELSPYICPVDILYSQTLGWGLTRTMTLAEGAQKCDFRFKKGGPTYVAVPPAMGSVISRGKQP